MTTKEIYELGIKLGIEADPRGKTGVERWLNLQNKNYEKLSKKDKDFFDKDRLTNPYSDSYLHYDAQPKKQIKTILAGIDIEVPEIALTKTITENNLQTKIDLIVTHHPQGKALAELDATMNMMADMMASYGIPINVAEGVMRERIQKVRRGIAPENHFRSIQAAQMAGISMLNMHTPCDNLVYQFLTDLMENNPSGKPETVGDVIDILKEVPEYNLAAKNGAGPMIFAGAAENRAGRVVASDITGGTSGAKEVYPALVRAGVGTIIGMHINEENREEAVKNHLNVVIAGHYSSDSLGMNIYLDELEKIGIEIISLGGLTRIKRFSTF